MLADKKEKDSYNKYFKQKQRLQHADRQLHKQESQIDKLQQQCRFKDAHVYCLTQYNNKLHQINNYYQRKRRQHPPATQRSTNINDLNVQPSKMSANADASKCHSTDAHERVPSALMLLDSQPKPLRTTHQQSFASKSSSKLLSTKSHGSIGNVLQEKQPTRSQANTTKLNDPVHTPFVSSIKRLKSVRFHKENTVIIINESSENDVPNQPYHNYQTSMRMLT